MKSIVIFLFLLSFGLQLCAQSEIEAPNSKAQKSDSTVIEFVGSAEIQKAITDNKEIPANAGIGVRFKRFYAHRTTGIGVTRIESDIALSIASTVDTITAIFNSDNEITNKDLFGNSVLLPLNSGQAVSIDARAFLAGSFDWVFFKSWGIHFQVDGSNRVWKVLDNSRNASTLVLKVGFFSEFVPPGNKTSDFSIALGIDVSNRWIFGDLGQPSSATFRKSVLGTDKKWFLGLEPHLTIQLRDIKASASFPILFTTKNSVPGLTNGQFVTTIRFVGGFPLRL